MFTKAAFVAVPLLIIVGIIRKYLDLKAGRCKSNHSLRGKTFLITGANSGIGLETARALVKRHARVIFACRNVESAKKVVDEIRAKQQKGGEMIIMKLDLSSFESIYEFTKIVKMGFAKIDVLINNAGVYVPLADDQKTAEGLEIHMGVNHVGHFLLTKLMMEMLEKAAPSRVVIVSSTLHERGAIGFEDLNLRGAIEAAKSKDKKKKSDRHNLGYCNSKLMNVYFGRALAERTKESKIDVYVVCPGFTYTNLFRHSLRWYHYVVMAPILLCYMRSAEQGSQTLLHCATDVSLEGQSGGFYRDCGPYVSKFTFDADAQNKLWEVTEKIIEENTNNTHE